MAPAAPLSDKEGPNAPLPSAPVTPPAANGTILEWDEAVRRIQGAMRLLLCSHRKPDGDAIGSLLGLGEALTSMGKTVTLACADAPPDSLAVLPGAERIVQQLPAYGDPADHGALPWELIVVLDAGGLDRLGALYEQHQALFATLPIVNLDHHFTNSRFGVANVVDAGAASATEVLVELLRRLGATPNVPAATSLLAGMMTDSLSFQTESTTGNTLRAAATLVDAGAPLAGLAYQLFRQRPRANAILWSKAASTLQFAAEGRIAWVEITRAMVEASGPGAESSGLSGFAGSIAGVQVGFQLEEGADGTIYLGFRSQSVDVAAIAAELGGGGHLRASGAHFPPPITMAEARAKTLAVIEPHVRKTNGR